MSLLKCGCLHFIKEIKKTCSSCIVELYKHAGIFKNTREVHREARGAFFISLVKSCCPSSPFKFWKLLPASVKDVYLKVVGFD